MLAAGVPAPRSTDSGERPPVRSLRLLVEDSPIESAGGEPPRLLFHRPAPRQKAIISA